MTPTVRRFSRGAAAISIVAVSGLLAGCSLVNGFIGTSIEEEGEQTGVFSIVVGDCLNGTGEDGNVSSVPTIDCAEPHDSEVFASVTLDDGDYPGEDAIFTAAGEGCVAEFADFIGLSYEESIADMQYYFPTELTWATGDREVLCLVYETNGDGEPIQTAGSLQGAGR